MLVGKTGTKRATAPNLDSICISPVPSPILLFIHPSDPSGSRVAATTRRREKKKKTRRQDLSEQSKKIKKPSDQLQEGRIKSTKGASPRLQVKTSPNYRLVSFLLTPLAHPSP